MFPVTDDQSKVIVTGWLIEPFVGETFVGALIEKQICHKKTFEYQGVPIRFLFHCSSSAREWNKTHIKYQIAQKAVAVTRKIIRNITKHQ